MTGKHWIVVSGMVAVLALTISVSNVVARDDRSQGPRNFIADFDKNNDGMVSEDEFPGPKNHFTKLDANQDGFIDESEAPQGPPPGHHPGGQRPGQGGEHNFIADFDKNGDGVVAQDEFPGPEDRFNQMDQNSDGFIDESEAPQGPPQGHSSEKSNPGYSKTGSNESTGLGSIDNFNGSGRTGGRLS